MPDQMCLICVSWTCALLLSSYAFVPGLGLRVCACTTRTCTFTQLYHVHVLMTHAFAMSIQLCHVVMHVRVVMHVHVVIRLCCMHKPVLHSSTCAESVPAQCVCAPVLHPCTQTLLSPLYRQQAAA